MKARLGALAVSALLLAACANGESAEVSDRAIELQSILGEAIEMGAFVAAEPSIPFDDPVVTYVEGLGDSLGPYVDDLASTFTRLTGNGTDGFGHEDGDESEHAAGTGSLDELLSVPADQLLPTFRRLMPTVLDNCATAAADVAATATDDALREIAAGARQACQEEAGRLGSLG